MRKSKNSDAWYASALPMLLLCFVLFPMRGERFFLSARAAATLATQHNKNRKSKAHAGGNRAARRESTKAE